MPTVTEEPKKSQKTVDETARIILIRNCHQKVILPMKEAPIDVITSGAGLMRLTSHSH